MVLGVNTGKKAGSARATGKQTPQRVPAGALGAPHRGGREEPHTSRKGPWSTACNGSVLLSARIRVYRELTSFQNTREKVATED